VGVKKRRREKRRREKKRKREWRVEISTCLFFVYVFVFPSIVLASDAISQIALPLFLFSLSEKEKESEEGKKWPFVIGPKKAIPPYHRTRPLNILVHLKDVLSPSSHSIRERNGLSNVQRVCCHHRHHLLLSHTLTIVL